MQRYFIYLIILTLFIALEALAYCLALQNKFEEAFPVAQEGINLAREQSKPELEMKVHCGKFQLSLFRHCMD